MIAAYLGLCERVVGALADPRRRTWTLLALLAGFVASWTLHGVLVHAFHDVHYDVGEAVGWWRDSSGAHHPPVSAWVVGAWFEVLPRADWLAYLLASITVALALLIAWALFGDWLGHDKRVVALAMLSFLPFFSFLGTKPNANLIQMPLWAAASLFFLRSFIRRGAGSSALAGLGLAAALLTKFWSVYLVAGMGLAALQDRRFPRYLASPAPWIAVAAAAALLVPAALSLAHDSGPLAFAIDTAREATFVEAATRSLTFLAASAAMALPALLALAALGPPRRALAAIVTPPDPDARLVLWLFVVPFVLPALANLAVPHRLTQIWTSPNWTLLPLVLLAPAALAVTRRDAARALAVAMVLPVVAVAAAPAIAAYLFMHDQEHGKLHYRSLAHAAESAWDDVSASPLRFIGGDRLIARGTAFYLESAAPLAAPGERYLEGMAPRLPPEGMVHICPARDTDCVAMLDAFERARGGARSGVELARSHFGLTPPAERFTILVTPPAR